MSLSPAVSPETKDRPCPKFRGNGTEIHVPLRVIANGHGAEVMLTLFRQPGMDDEMFARDVKWITRDLRALKAFAMA